VECSSCRSTWGGWKNGLLHFGENTFTVSLHEGPRSDVDSERCEAVTPSLSEEVVEATGEIIIRKAPVKRRIVYPRVENYPGEMIFRASFLDHDDGSTVWILAWRGGRMSLYRFHFPDR
jgi:hypothetical protein